MKEIQRKEEIQSVVQSNVHNNRLQVVSHIFSQNEHSTITTIIITITNNFDTDDTGPYGTE